MRQLLSPFGIGTSHAPVPSAPGPGGPVEEVRAAMLQALGDPGPHTLGLALRIRHAIDAERLWYLRCELMQALARAQGEALAAQRLARITALFHDHP